MTRIAISYRRDDSDAITGRIFDRLVAHYGREAVFRDIDDIPLGIDFRDYIAAMLHKSDVVLVVIGPRWAGARGGRSRIADPADPVRIEVETSLRMGIPVVPVLVGRAGMPKVEQLPDSLKDLAYRNGLRVDAAQDFDHHLDRLLRALDKLLADRKSVPAAGQAAERAAADPASSEGGASSGDASSVVESGADPHPPAAHDNGTSLVAAPAIVPAAPIPPPTATTEIKAVAPGAATSSTVQGDAAESKTDSKEIAVYEGDFHLWTQKELKEIFGVILESRFNAKRELQLRGYQIRWSILKGAYLIRRPADGQDRS